MSITFFTRHGRALLLMMLAIGIMGCGGDDNPSGGGNTYSLAGVWERSDGRQVTVSGNIGIINALGSLTALGQSALDKGYLKIGDQYWKGFTSTGNLTWSGQALVITCEASSPTVAIGTIWINETFTLSADGQTLNETEGAFTDTWTRKQ